MSTMLTSGKAAAYLGVGVKTLQRWDRVGILASERTGTNRRVYDVAALDAFLSRSRRRPIERHSVAYCRVSSAAQRPDLRNQRRVLEEFCAARGLANVDFVEEIGGGMNLTRPKFAAVIDAIEAGRVSHLVIAHKDRLARFGFDWFKRVCEKHGCEMLTLNAEHLSPEEEMTQDLLAIVHCFSARLYGLRHYRKALEQALRAPLEQAAAASDVDPPEATP